MIKKESQRLARYDSAEFLDSNKAIHAYMEEALETDDPAFIAKALAPSLAHAACHRLPRKPGYPAKASTKP